MRPALGETVSGTAGSAGRLIAVRPNQQPLTRTCEAEMPRRTFAPNYATTWRCSAKRCLFTDSDPKVVGQHEHDAHGPAWMAADQDPQQPTAKAVNR